MGFSKMGFAVDFEVLSHLCLVYALVYGLFMSIGFLITNNKKYKHLKALSGAIIRLAIMI